jgi:hypothetical protein
MTTEDLQASGMKLFDNQKDWSKNSHQALVVHTSPVSGTYEGIGGDDGDVDSPDFSGFRAVKAQKKQHL